MKYNYKPTVVTFTLPVEWGKLLSLLLVTNMTNMYNHEAYISASACSVGIVTRTTDLMKDDMGFDSLHEQTSRPALRPTQPPIGVVPEAL
jgi:hypothetical protein